MNGALSVDERICDFVRKVHAKVPLDKKLTAAVVVQLLSTKFAEQFKDVVISEKVLIIEAELTRLQAPPPPAAPASAAAEEDSNDSDDDESDDPDEELEEEDEESSDEESEDDSSSSSGSASVAGEDDGTGEPIEKKARIEETEADEAVAVTDMLPAKRVEKMLVCLNKLSYRPRKQLGDESAEAYLADVVVPYFVAKGLDPNAFGKSDVKRYKLRKELNDLQADGGNLSLDRNQRRGRLQVVLPPPQSETVVKPAFLDDEE